MENLIDIQELVIHHELELDFVSDLEDCAVIEIIVKEKKHYVHSDELPRLERIIRLYRDLQVNMEGIEVIEYMRDRTSLMQLEIRRLRQRLDLYE